ncbi:MAG TPA: DUF488 domain-containing protein, partial [Thermoplasmatales archaeon]|nr:DUF488 domain-containing protein [Thermoplasmatales archaeon]
NIEEFIGLLKEFNIDIVVDVRRFPTSRFEQFRKENLKLLVEEKGIKYIYLGDILGGYREGGYKKYVETKDFQRGLREIEVLSSRGKIVLLCCEKFPWRCHRWFISNELTKLGYQVIHIIDKGWTYIHRTLDSED